MVGDSAYKLLDRLGSRGRDAWSSSQTAASDLKTQGFALGGGLDRIQERWEAQLRTLLDACGHISNHLDFTRNTHKNDDHHVYGIISSIAELDKGFDDGRRS
ncbi:hypothetical protein SAMN05421806_105431 [Streptomyces indicus]|uniref:Excreted virulence factor EspC, type VII ESX diderm n=2 Tax=Streptomyces indicus TaxID=417292 RepID=A0A1G9A8Z0_9ACTN|nr:hypothetical protein SAMN05421806_105431 [Streptomyces indicus]